GPARTPRAEFMAPPQRDDGRGELPAVPVGQAQVAVGVGMVRVERKGLPVAGDGLVEFLLAAEGIALAIVAVCQPLPRGVGPARHPGPKLVPLLEGRDGFG